jgi:hypothetical protein|tara:strand:+ start:1251 stop:1463 length:213 start_codon:yes stop_codon:yes gene_type:complete
MDISEQSIIHVEKHIEESFSEIMEDYIIENMYWNDDDPNNIRAIAQMFHPQNNSLNNLFVLFPPLIVEKK